MSRNPNISDENKKCEANELQYLSNPVQLKCKNCHRFWFQKDQTPICKAVEINTIFPTNSSQISSKLAEPKREKHCDKCSYETEEGLAITGCAYCGCHTSQPKKSNKFDEASSFAEEVSQNMHEAVNNGLLPKESIRDEWNSLFPKNKELSSNEIVDFFLQRCIPRDELKEKIEHLFVHEINHPIGRAMSSTGFLSKDDVLSLISKQ